MIKVDFSTLQGSVDLSGLTWQILQIAEALVWDFGGGPLDLFGDFNASFDITNIPIISFHPPQKQEQYSEQQKW